MNRSILKTIALGIAFSVLLGIMAHVLCGCGSKLYTSLDTSGTYQSYTIGEAVVDVPSFVFTDTTSITSISQNVDYSEGAYCYEDEDMIISFNMSGYLFAFQKGTSFSDDVTSSSLCDIWFTALDETTSSTTDSVFKSITPVIGDYAVTTNLYNTFYGALSVIEINGEQYSVFIGAYALSEDDISDSDQKIIDHITESLSVSEDEGSYSGSEEENEESSDVSKEVTVEKID